MFKTQQYTVYSKKIVKQCKYNLQQTFCRRIHSISKEARVDIKATEKLRKSAWKKLIKQKIMGNRPKRLWDEMGRKTKLRTIKDGKWERKRYTEQCKKEI